MMVNGDALPVPTIYQVAERAGVSIATVSRAFGDPSKVAPRTRDAVFEAARELRYVPAAAARALAVRRSKALGVVLPHIAGPYYAELLVGFEIAASELGLSVVLVLAKPQEHRPAAVLDLLGRVDGMAFMARSGADDEIVRQVSEVRPTVSVARGRVDGVDAFYAENRRSAQHLTEHLIGHGRRRIGFVGRPEEGSDIGRRHRGHLDALAAAGLSPARHFAVDPVESAGREVAEQLLAVAQQDLDRAVPTAPTAESSGAPRGIAGLDALVCGNDELALAIIARLATAGVDVPGELAVTGWDDTVTARYLSPGLTTVRQEVAQLGALAARRLAARIDGAAVQEPCTVGSTLVLRESCGCSPLGVSGAPPAAALPA
ncbi:LacI family transcriptional regulator [Brachybacterium vulturis]|uniref:LacI family transcriptional regulator n=1 Tax=Brachybacterium vulturis TaxID=2017484 RepID=A0A291GN03_9MICO|nr:LacI family DNA-binding transcriptional regulator [Brachybacterium vulturis]ATG51460.1 LacI family transcriptional regulator [Brachybacterium vulturis]